MLNYEQYMKPKDDAKIVELIKELLAKTKATSYEGNAYV